MIGSPSTLIDFGVPSELNTSSKFGGLSGADGVFCDGVGCGPTTGVVVEFFLISLQLKYNKLFPV